MSRSDAGIIDRLNMMAARGALIATDDSDAVQTMQADILDGEVVDDLERFQSYGVSSVPPAGDCDLALLFIGGNRDQGLVVGVNHRGTRPTGLEAGEIAIYSGPDCIARFNKDNDIVIKCRRLIIEVEEHVEITAPEGVTIKTDTRLRVEGDIEATGSIREGVARG